MPTHQIELHQFQFKCSHYNCFNLYNKLVDQEIEMESYFILAKKPGRLHTIFVEQGDHVTNKDTIAITNYNIPLLVKSTVSK